MTAVDPRDLTCEQLLELRQPSEVTLSNDGEKIAFVAADASMETGEALASGIWVGPIGGAIERVTWGPGSDTFPRFSPNGPRLAFASDRDHVGRMSLYLLEPGGEAWAHGDVKGAVEAIEWSQDGAHIFVLAADMGSDSAGINVSRVIEELDAEEPDPLVKRPSQLWRRLFRIDAKTGETAEVSPEQVNVWEFMPHPSGITAIVSDAPSESAWYDAYIALIDPDSRTMKRIYDPEWQLQAPQLSPDGSRIAFIEGVCSDRLLVTGTMTVVELGSGKKTELAADRDVTRVWWVGHDRLAFVGRSGLGSHCGFVSLDDSGRRLTRCRSRVVASMRRRQAQTSAISAPSDGAGSGRRIIRKALRKPSRPARIGMASATCRASGRASVLMRTISARTSGG